MTESEAHDNLCEQISHAIKIYLESIGFNRGVKLEWSTFAFNLEKQPIENTKFNIELGGEVVCRLEK